DQPTGNGMRIFQNVLQRIDRGTRDANRLKAMQHIHRRFVADSLLYDCHHFVPVADAILVQSKSWIFSQLIQAELLAKGPPQLAVGNTNQNRAIGATKRLIRRKASMAPDAWSG